MRTRGVLLLTSIVVMVVVGAGIALAANISCPSGGGKCLGTNKSDNITGSNNKDKITGAAGGDTINAKGGNDEAYGDAGDDTLNGGEGSDYGEGGRGNNTVNGQGGDSDVSNVVDGDANDFASGGDGGNDQCIVDGGGFVGSGAIFSGPDTNGDDFSNTCEDVYRARE